MNGISTFITEASESSPDPFAYEHTASRQPFMNQEEDSHQTPNLLTLMGGFQPPEL